MMKTTVTASRVLLVFLILATFPSAAKAHGGGYGALSIPVSYDRATGAYGEGFDQNVVVMIFNLGWSFRHWDDEVVGWNKKTIRNEFSLYAGLGLGGLIQLQAGFSPAGTRMRIRSDIPLTGGDKLYDSPGEGSFIKGILLTPFIETDFDKSLYGISIGFAY